MTTEILVRNRFSPRVPVRILFNDTDRKAKQSFKDECDINNIMRRFQRTGVLTHVAKYSPMYGDFPAMDYRESMDRLIEADRMFSELPAKLRKRFHNSPQEFLEFVQDSENLDEMVKLGLVKPAPAKPEPAGAPAPSSSSGGQGAEPPTPATGGGSA